MNSYDVIIIGAGPCGLACGIEAEKRGLRYLIMDKGTITESIRRYPKDMIFFSSADNISIGEIPFTSLNLRPGRKEALNYYRRVSDYFKLNLQLFTKVEHIGGEDGHFQLETNKGNYTACKVVLAIGYYDLPRKIGVPGEELPHVSHYYDEPYMYTRSKTVVVGGANSAIETALDLYRHGAEVTLIHILEDLDKRAKYWIVPDLRNRIKNNEVTACFNTEVKEIREQSITVRNKLNGVQFDVDADFVFLMTGYRPDADFMESIGINLKGDAHIPEFDQSTYESNVAGIYLAGSVVGGEETAKVFIENGKLHSKPVMDDIEQKLG